MGTRSLIIDSNNCYIYPMANSLRGGAKASETNIRDLFGVLLSKSSAKTAQDFYPKMNINTNDWYTPIVTNSKGTIGDAQSGATINSLPTQGYNLGDAYKVITEGTYAGKYCLVNDVIFAIKNGPSSGSTIIDDDWDKIPYDSSWTSYNKFLHVTLNTTIGVGKGNCNGYYVDLSKDTDFTVIKDFELNTSDSTKNIFNLQIYFRIIYSGTGICDGAFLWAGTEDEANTIFNQDLKQYGFYDVGILLGTVNIDAHDYEHNNVVVRYYYNNDITNCIDINRLGDANGSFVSQLYNKLNRLYTLMLDSGFMTVGTVLENKAIKIDDEYYKFNPEPGTEGYKHKDELVSHNKIQMYIKPTVHQSPIIDIKNTPPESLDSQIIPGTVVGKIGGETCSVTTPDESKPYIVSFKDTIEPISSVTINLYTGEYTVENTGSKDISVEYSFNKDGSYDGGLQYTQYDGEGLFSNTQDIIRFSSENIADDTDPSIIASKITRIHILGSAFTENNLSVNTITTNTINMGDNTISLSISGDTLTIDAPHTNISGDLSLDSSISVTNSDKTGTITADRVFGAVWQ